MDADVFIQAKNLHCGLDFCPAFWDWLIVNNTARLVFSVEKVGDEVMAGDDELADWAKVRGDAFYLKPDHTTLASLATVSTWATSQQYQPAAVTTFLQLADYYLVAQAHAGGYTVVTHEIPSASVKRIKIPDACIGLPLGAGGGGRGIPARRAGASPVIMSLAPRTDGETRRQDPGSVTRVTLGEPPQEAEQPRRAKPPLY